MIKLKEILLNEDIPDDVKAAFGEIPFGEDPRTAVFTKGNKKTEQDTSFENELRDILINWTKETSSMSQLANTLYNKYPILKRAAQYFPDVLKPSTPSGTKLYRGVNNTDMFVREFIESVSLSDFEASDVAVNFIRYKHPIQYKPRRPVQSWTDDFQIASQFGNRFVLETTQDDDFLFNQQLMYHYFEDDDEHEVLHFGNDFKNPVYLNVSIRQFELLQMMMLTRSAKLPKTKNEVENILHSLGVSNYEINDDLSVNTGESVVVKSVGLVQLPLKFRHVGGHFDCKKNRLVTFENFPDTIDGDLICSDNKLESLVGMPKKIGGSFVCMENRIKKLNGLSSSIGKSIYLYGNELESLEGAPAFVNGDFDCAKSRLRTLKGSPQKVAGGFYCDNNNLSSLREGPRVVEYTYNARNNPLTPDEEKWATENIRAGKLLLR